MGEQQGILDKQVGIAARTSSNGHGDVGPGVEAAMKRKCPWSHAEHLLFLLGLQTHGRGAWRAIALDFCISRTPTQVASHAQKYFARQELTPLKRHKTRASIHDITCDTIHPLASASNRDSIRLTLQRIVREGKDLVASGDSATDSSATSSARSTPANCLPVQDPIFPQVFAFTTTAVTDSNGTSASHAVVFHSSPQPLLYASMHMQPLAVLPQLGYGDAAAIPQGGVWAVRPLAGPIARHAPPVAHPGLGVLPPPLPLTPATAGDHMHGHHQQPQVPYFMPSQGSDLHMWPHQPMVHGQGIARGGPFPAHPALMSAFPAVETHATRRGAPAASHARTQVAKTAGYVYHHASGVAGPVLAPWLHAGMPGTSAGLQSSPQLTLHPQGNSQAKLLGVAIDSDRGKKREGCDRVDQSRLSNVLPAHSLPPKVAKGTRTTSPPAATDMHVVPQPQPARRYAHPPPRPDLRTGLKLLSAPALAPYATVPRPIFLSPPDNMPHNRPMHVDVVTTCMRPSSIPLTSALPRYTLPRYSLPPGIGFRPRGGGGGRGLAAAPSHAAVHSTSALQGHLQMAFKQSAFARVGIIDTAVARPQEPPPRNVAQRLSPRGRGGPGGAASNAFTPYASSRSAVNSLHAVTESTGACPNSSASTQSQNVWQPPQLPQPPQPRPMLPVMSLDARSALGISAEGVRAQEGRSVSGPPEWLLGEHPPMPQLAPRHGGGAAQSLTGVDDLMVYLVGNRAAPSDSACTAAYSWEIPRSRSGGWSGSGAHLGGDGSRGSGGVDSVDVEPP